MASLINMRIEAAALTSCKVTLEVSYPVGFIEGLTPILASIVINVRSFDFRFKEGTVPSDPQPRADIKAAYKLFGSLGSCVLVLEDSEKSGKLDKLKGSGHSRLRLVFQAVKMLRKAVEKRQSASLESEKWRAREECVKKLRAADAASR